MNKRAKELSEKRKARLAAAKAQEAKTANTAPAPKPETPRELTAKVADPSKVSEKDAVQLVGPFNTETDNPHWIVLAGGSPLAKIALADQDEPDKMRKVFAMNDYAKSFMSTLKEIPLIQMLNATKARPYVASVRSTEVFASLDKKYQEEGIAAFQKKAASYRDDLGTMVGLVVEAQRKNFLVQNPLKEALFKSMVSAGVENPERIIESAFVEASGEHFSMVLAQAQKWMEYSAEALADIKAQVTEMPVREVKARTVVNTPTTPVPSAKHNVPLSTPKGEEREAQPMDLKDQMKARLNLRGRMHAHDMQPKG